nr:hypothetical protein XNW1_4580004 [Xenorhabdus nematophila str. Websteri]
MQCSAMLRKKQAQSRHFQENYCTTKKAVFTIACVAVNPYLSLRLNLILVVGGQAFTSRLMMHPSLILMTTLTTCTE